MLGHRKDILIHAITKRYYGLQYGMMTGWNGSHTNAYSGHDNLRLRWILVLLANIGSIYFIFPCIATVLLNSVLTQVTILKM